VYGYVVKTDVQESSEVHRHRGFIPCIVNITMVDLHILIDRLQSARDGEFVLELNSDPLVSQCLEH
jgi:hypothetical protein